MSDTDVDNVITSNDVVTKVPKSFKDLSKEQLVEAANYFGTENQGVRKEIESDLVDSYVTWDMYVKAFKLPGHEELPELTNEWPEQVDVEDAPEEEENVTDNEVLAAEPVKLAPADKYLIKMTRKNPYFEFAKYKFTTEKPYAIMTAADAQRILETEEGFRQAFPAELQEFYS